MGWIFPENESRSAVRDTVRYAVRDTRRRGNERPRAEIAIGRDILAQLGWNQDDRILVGWGDGADKGKLRIFRDKKGPYKLRARGKHLVETTIPLTLPWASTKPHTRAACKVVAIERVQEKTGATSIDVRLPDWALIEEAAPEPAVADSPEPEAEPEASEPELEDDPEPGPEDEPEPEPSAEVVKAIETVAPKPAPARAPKRDPMEKFRNAMPPTGALPDYDSMADVLAYLKTKNVTVRESTPGVYEVKGGVGAVTRNRIVALANNHRTRDNLPHFHLPF